MKSICQQLLQPDIACGTRFRTSHLSWRTYQRHDVNRGSLRSRNSRRSSRAHSRSRVCAPATRISRWANLHGPQYSTLLWVVGSHVNMKTGHWDLSWSQILSLYNEAMKNLAKRRGSKEPVIVPSKHTLQRRLAKLRESGIVIALPTHGKRLKTGAFNETAYGRNRWSVDLTHVLLPDGSVADHDFLAAIPEPVETIMEDHQLGTRCGTRCGTHYRCIYRWF